MALFTAKDSVQVFPQERAAVTVRLVVLTAMAAGAKATHPAPVTVIAPPVARRFGGKLSVSPGLASDTATEFGFVIAIESVASAPGATAVGLKDFATVTVEERPRGPHRVGSPCVLPSAATTIVLA